MSIEINHVTKAFGSVKALNNVSITFEDNRIYGLLGRNGAGKSTLLNLITNRIFASSGEILVDGVPVQENDSALSKIYLMSEKTLYPSDMRVCDVFKWTKRFYPSFNEGEAARIAEKFELNIYKKVKSLSTGFTSIFKLVIALCIHVPYIFLDEPVLGLDANNRELFYSLLIEMYAKSPCTIVLSTHLIEEVSGVIEDVIIIDNGKIIKDSTREELLASGYSVSGKASDVDAYTMGKEIIGSDTLGGLKTAYLLGIPDADISSSLELSPLDLQKLFVKLTSTKEEQI